MFIKRFVQKTGQPVKLTTRLLPHPEDKNVAARLEYKAILPQPKTNGLKDEEKYKAKTVNLIE